MRTLAYYTIISPGLYFEHELFASAMMSFRFCSKKDRVSDTRYSKGMHIRREK